MKVAGLSVDDMESPMGWIGDIEETQGTALDFPLIADPDRVVATPANWQHGQDVIVLPALSNEEAIERFPKGVEILKPYLRITPQPNS